MANNTQYRFSSDRKDLYITFDANGYIVEAKGFESLMWSKFNPDIDKELIGKHVDELSEMLEKNAVDRNQYLEFEAHVHVGLLKAMLQDAKK